jgi:protein O-mannosyl-transferase
MTKKYTYLIIIFLITTSLIAYGRILGNGFINFDDNVYITKNSHVQSGLNIQTVKWALTAVVSSNWHPLTLISHAIDWSMFGNRASGHHFINLLLHIGVVLLLFLFLHRTTSSIWPSAFVAALFALHPLRVESVAWAAERKDVLSMFLGLGVLYAYTFYVEKRHVSKYIFCLILFAMGLMAKPMLVTLPFVLLLLDYWPLQRWKKEIKLGTNDTKVVPLKKKDKQHGSQSIKQHSSVKAKDQPTTSQRLWEKAPFFILAIISSVVTIWAQQKGGSLVPLQKISFPERFMNSVVSYVLYLQKTFWPMDLAIFYPYQHVLPFWQFWGALLILLLISAVVILYIRRLPFLFVGWFWYLGTLIPVIGLVQVGRQALADRYTYLPSIGIGIILTWGIMSLLPKERLHKIILIPLAVIVIILMTVLTWQQCGYWKNSVELFNHTLQATKDNYLAHDSLGVALDAEGKHQDAIYHYQNSIKINPEYDNAYYNLANAFKDQKNMEEAANNFRETIRVNPNYVDAHNNLGIILETYYKKYDEAIYHYHRALQIDSNNPGIHFNLGIALAAKGERQEAIKHFQRAIYLKPDYDAARQWLRLTLGAEQKQTKR